MLSGFFYRWQMALTSSSTLSDALAQYSDNLNWQGDATKAAAALESVRWLLVNRPSANSMRGRSINYESLYQEKTKLEEYIDKFGAASTARRVSFTKGRALI